jgi:hypothetical protein
LFLDAQEMDGELHGRDLDKKVMIREMRKLASGFRGLFTNSISSLGSTDELKETEILGDSGLARNTRREVVLVVPPWGCGTFGGDFKVKLLLIWLVASLYGVPNQEQKSNRDESDVGGDSKVRRSGIKEIRLAVKRSWWEGLDESWRAFIGSLACETELNKGKMREIQSVAGLWKYLYDCSEEGGLRIHTD